MIKFLFIIVSIITTYYFISFYPQSEKINNILIEMESQIDNKALDEIEKCLMLDNQKVLAFHEKENNIIYLSKYSLIRFQTISYLYTNLVFDRRRKNFIPWIVDRQLWFFFSYLSLSYNELLMINFYYFPWCRYRGIEIEGIKGQNIIRNKDVK